MTRRTLGLDHLTFLDRTPAELVEIAGGAGFDCVNLRISPSDPTEYRYPMAIGSAPYRHTRSLAADLGVEIFSIEVIAIHPDTDPAGFDEVFDIAASLGVRVANVAITDTDLIRASDKFAATTDLAGRYGITTMLEPMIYRAVCDIATAMTIIDKAPGSALLIDALHYQRFGGTVDQLRLLDPALFKAFQICDAPAEVPENIPAPDTMPINQVYNPNPFVAESRSQRLIPGEGAIPLVEILRALPEQCPITAEDPNYQLTQKLGHRLHAKKIHDAMITVVEQLA
ncbi:sugar phosphate isomerase/epimerase family protein [Rhodococcus koreensis]